MKKVFSENKFLIFPILTFCLLLLPFINIIPYLDGNIDFVKAYDFYTGGFERYFNNWPSVHPPLKPLVTSFIFRIGGIKPLSYNFIGLAFGVVGIVAIYSLAQKLLDKKTAQISSFLLALSPLYISVGIFSLIDYLLTILILLSLLFYLQKKYFLYFLFATLGVMTKETGLLLPLSIITIESVYLLKGRFARSGSKEPIYRFLFYMLPLIVFFFWKKFIESYGQSTWSDWIFAETKDKGAIYTIINNLITFRFLNKYAYQQWLQLLVLNFNWIYWLTSFAGLTIFLSKSNNLKKFLKYILTDDLRAKTTLVMVIFSGAYFFTVLTFQTYTIPRYALPLVPFLLIVTALSINKITDFFRLSNAFISAFFVLLTPITLFTSSDPLSIKLWGKTKILDQEIYALNRTLAGNDGITYNMQFLLISRQRSRSLSQNSFYNTNGGRTVLGISSTRPPVDCYWLFPDVNNDKKTIKILKIEDSSMVKNCIKP